MQNRETIKNQINEVKVIFDAIVKNYGNEILVKVLKETFMRKMVLLTDQLLLNMNRAERKSHDNYLREKYYVLSEMEYVEGRYTSEQYDAAISVYGYALLNFDGE